MYKHSPNRNQRSKGFKVNQVLQICVLVAACIWLIYEVNHFHNKKKDFEETDAISLPDTNDLKIGGRKGLHDTLEKEPLIKEKNVEEETEEENELEEDDSKHEESVEDFKNKHEEDEQEQENSETENEHDVDILDEERDREEVDDSEDKEDENYMEDHDHEAREKHYKGDDASSAVTHESESVSAKTENRNPENIIKKMEANGLEDEKLANISGFIVDNNTTGEIAGNVISLNTTTTSKKKSDYVSSKQKEIPVSSSTMTAKFDINQEETGNDLAKKRKPTNDILVMNSTEAKQSVDQGDISMKPSLNNTRPHSNSVDVQHTETVQRQTSNPSIMSKTVVLENKKMDVKTQENKNDNLEMRKEMAYSYTEEGGVDHHDPIDDSDTTISLEKDVRRDTNNLRDIRTEGSNDKKAALE